MVQWDFSLIKNRDPRGAGLLCPPGYTFYQGRRFKLQFKLEFEFEFDFEFYYTFKFKFKFKVVAHPSLKNRGYPKKQNALSNRQRGNAETWATVQHAG
jgi:hypothetical protein